MEVFVRDNDVNGALRVLKKKMQREGVFREMKRRRSYEKPSERRVREKAEAVRRHRKMCASATGTKAGGGIQFPGGDHRLPATTSPFCFAPLGAPLAKSTSQQLRRPI